MLLIEIILKLSTPAEPSLPHYVIYTIAIVSLVWLLPASRVPI